MKMMKVFVYGEMASRAQEFYSKLSNRMIDVTINFIDDASIQLEFDETKKITSTFMLTSLKAFLPQDQMKDVHRVFKM